MERSILKTRIHKKPQRHIKIIRYSIIFIIFINLFTTLQPNTDASLLIVTLEEFDQAQRTANVRPGENVPVVFYGNISIDRFILSKSRK